MSIKSNKKKKLSKHILEMKFMQKTKEKVLKQYEEEEGRAMFASEITDGMVNGKSKYFIQPSFAICGNLTQGRVSFLGMNPFIEKLMAEEAVDQSCSQGVKEEADVSLDEMSQTLMQHSSLHETVANKFRKNRKNQSHDYEPNRKKLRLSDS